MPQTRSQAPAWERVSNGGQRAPDVSRGSPAGELITAPISPRSDWRCQVAFGLARRTHVLRSLGSCDIETSFNEDSRI